jgi:signal transduction histidine kinase
MAQQDQLARTAKQRIDAAIDAALAAVDRAATGDRSTLAAAPLATFWFWLDADGSIRAPATSFAASSSVDRAADRNAPVGRVDDYLRELSRRQDRAAKLRGAQRTEACGTEACMAEARRQYTALVGFDDTAPEALLGLARVQLRIGDARASATLAELDRRFGDRSFPGERVPVKLVTALMRAEADPHRADALLDVAYAVLDGQFVVAPVVGVGVATRVRGELAGDPAVAPRIAALDGKLAAIRETARAAAGLAPDVDAIMHAATSSWRGQPSSRQSGRTLIYRRRADKKVIGIAVDSAMLADAAGADAASGLSPQARAIVLPVGTQPAAQDRVLSQVAFGERLPHLALALVDPIGEPDPLDEVIRARSRRHVILTSGLALLLGVGLLATIRGAVRARELAQLKSDFVSTVSHELKTPLTSIRMFAEMLEQGVAHGDADKMHRYHGVIVQESQRLGLLIANLLDYAQIERGTRRYSPSTVAIDRLARDAVATFEALRDPDRGGRNPIAVDVSPDAMAIELEIDRDVVVQAVLNLLANASKYGGADRPIEVRVDTNATSASIAVRDHGPGIPSHEQARIFREFYRTPDAYRSNIEGTGLGLALVKRHIEALGGNVEVSSTLGEGATFTIRLPRGANA